MTGATRSPPAVIIAGDAGAGIGCAGFEALLRSDRFAEHRRKLWIEIEHWPLTRGGEDFRPAVTRTVFDSVLLHSWLYYQACLPTGEGKVRRRRAALKATARKAAKRAGDLAVLARQLWISDNPVVRGVLGPLAGVHPPADGLPVELLDPGFVAVFEQFQRKAELLATALPADVGGRPQSITFTVFAKWLAGIYSTVTGEPAMPSTRTGAPEGRFFGFIKAAVHWLRAAAPELPEASFDLPASNHALRVALRRIAQMNTTPHTK